MVLKNGKPIIAISVAGGDLQDQTTLNILLNHIHFGMLPAEAVVAPRFSTAHHQDSFDPNPDRNAAFVGRNELTVYAEISEETRKDLAERGHILKTTSGPIGNPVMIYVDSASGKMYAAGDPKSLRHAAALE